MKRLLITLCISASFYSSKAQSHEVQQLLLNWEKLTQFKQILQNMYDGYKVLHAGYTTIKDISEGNFSLHKTFLDALFEVSPAVRKYKRIADIIRYQSGLVKNYRAAFNAFKESGQLNEQEIDYLSKVYRNLFNTSLQSLEELVMVITAGQLRMSDEERLEAIDRIYESVTDQYAFLEDFNSSTSILVHQRKVEQADIDLSRRLR